MANVNDRSSKAMKALKRGQRAKRLPCWLCGQPIDYDAPPDDPNSFSYDHAKPWDTHPALRLDPGNGRSAHLRCNKARGKRDPRPGLGLRSREV
ncbi:HNH endonuclease [Cellulosimicrobium cellulans]|nr:HNH endonuclease [Cellulosimicrobium cellulans]